MSYERDEYMRRQEAEHDMIRMREPRLTRQYSPHLDRTEEMIADLVALLNEAAEFIQPFNRAGDLLNRIESALAKMRGTA